MRAVVCALLIAGAAQAAPKYSHKTMASKDADVVAAEAKWAVAAAEKNPRTQVDLWIEASEAFLVAAENGKLAKAEQTEAAFAAVLAIKNGLAVDPRTKSQVQLDEERGIPKPKEIPDNEKKLLRVFDKYRTLDATSDDSIGVEFLTANIFRRYNQFDKAIPLFLDILDNHRKHETAEYSANLLLDTYNRLQRYDEMIALADKIRADKAFLKDKEDLEATVNKLHRIARRKEVEGIERRAKENHDLALYDECGDKYAASDEHGPDDDETLYNAMYCYQAGGSWQRALAMGAELEKRYPKSRLVGRALARTIYLHGQVGHLEDAAAAAELYVTRFGGEKDALNALSDAIYYRKGLRDFTRAAKLVDDLAKLFPTKRAEIAAANVSLVGAMLVAGDRAGAVKRIAARPLGGGIEAARVLVNASCPLAPDELGRCAKPRDAKLVAAARAELQRTHDNDAPILIKVLDEPPAAAAKPEPMPERLSPPHSPSITDVETLR